MNTTRGTLGFTIPNQTLTGSQEVNLTAKDVSVWRNALPMADVGSTAKKVYHALNDCNRVKLDPKTRFEILELLRAPVQFVCQSLNKHYTNQTAPLNKQQLTIIELATTLQSEMALGYKLVVEEGMAQSSASFQNTILPVALQRILHFFTHILLRSYALYSNAPAELWQEVHLVYRVAEQQGLAKQNELLLSYLRIVLLACAFPYQWRQTEQQAIFDASEKWASSITLERISATKVADYAKPGFFINDFKDHPPFSPFRIESTEKITEPCLLIDVNPIVLRLKTLLGIIEPNELQARMEHMNDPEYAVSASILRGLIKTWSLAAKRSDTRKETSENVRICIGLSATHFFLNNEKPFQPPQTENADASYASGAPLPTLGFQEEGIASDTQKSKLFEPYPCILIDSNQLDYGLLWQGPEFPPIQAGEIVGVEKTYENNAKRWELAKLLWLRYLAPGKLKMGLKKLGLSAKPTAVQVIKEGKNAGYYLRGLIFEPSILTPTLPFKINTQVSIVESENTPPYTVTLTELLDSTGSYKQFKYTSSSTHGGNEPPPLPKEKLNAPPKKKPEAGEEGFDSIWSNL